MLLHCHGNLCNSYLPQQPKSCNCKKKKKKIKLGWNIYLYIIIFAEQKAIAISEQNHKCCYPPSLRHQSLWTEDF